MTFKFDDITVGKRVFIGDGEPLCLGTGPAEIRGSAFIEAPMVVGDPQDYPTVYATVMIGQDTNPDSPPPFIPGAIQACGLFNHSPYSLCVSGDAAIFDNLDVNRNIIAGENIQLGRNLIAQGEVWSHCGQHKLHIKKDFDIPHPTKDGWRLTHACVEGPEAAVYVRGRVDNKNEIELPEYWTNLIDYDTITVSLTPIGSHQNIIVKRIADNKIYLQSNGGMPISCFYHVFAERADTEKLIPEYEGTIEDYPGDNLQRSIAGYHYDQR